MPVPVNSKGESKQVGRWSNIPERCFMSGSNVNPPAKLMTRGVYQLCDSISLVPILNDQDTATHWISWRFDLCSIRKGEGWALQLRRRRLLNRWPLYLARASTIWRGRGGRDLCSCGTFLRRPAKLLLARKGQEDCQHDYHADADERDGIIGPCTNVSRGRDWVR